MKFSDNQQRAIKEIKTVTGYLGEDRWFIQEEIAGAGYKTLMALVNKGFLITRFFGDRDYYQMSPEHKKIN